MATQEKEIVQAQVKALDGASIHYRKAAPKKTTAVLIILHGYAEHGGRYEELMTVMAQQGVATYVPDHRGHGESAQLLGYVSDLDLIISDVLLFRAMAKADHAGKPVFIMGHSMGGMLALLHGQRYPADLAGLICCGSGILVPPNIPEFMVKFSVLLGRIFPKLPLQPFFDEKKLSRLPEIQAEVLADPLFYRGWIRARTGAQILYGMKTTVAGLSQMKLPMLILHGGSDQVVPPAASELIASKVTTDDLTHKVFPDSLHEVFHEPERTEAMALVSDWLAARL